MNRKYFLQASSISVHAEQGGESKDCHDRSAACNMACQLCKEGKHLVFQEPAQAASCLCPEENYWHKWVSQEGLPEEKVLHEKPRNKKQVHEKFLPCLHTTPSKLYANCAHRTPYLQKQSYSFLSDNICGRRT